MLTTEDDILIKQETSCSKEEAIAKLLGWMRGPLRRKYVEFTPGWISEDQLPYLYSLEGTVQAHLQDLRTTEHAAYHQAAIIDMEDVIAEEKRQSVARIDGLILNAARYLREIESELDRGDASLLKIDHEATESTGVIQLTLSSLDRWSHQQFKFSIFEPPSLPPVPEIVAEKPTSYHVEPWLTVKEGDPDPKEPWYTPARYFARELVRADITLDKPKKTLAVKVVDALADAGIKKRRGVGKFDSATILKAFSKVKLIENSKRGKKLT